VVNIRKSKVEAYHSHHDARFSFPAAGIWLGRGGDGLHYTLFSRRAAGWSWVKDEDKPAFPSLFLDRAELEGKIGGRLDLDVAFFVNGDGMGQVANQVEVRRSRFYTSGALETAVRFSCLDLDDGPVQGGTLRAVTAGVNWYLHSHSKIRFNYVFTHAGGGPRDGDLHAFETRVEFDF